MLNSIFYYQKKEDTFAVKTVISSGGTFMGLEIVSILQNQLCKCMSLFLV